MISRIDEIEVERPTNVGVKAIELYFPSQCVDQADLEAHDGVSKGKYTVGLGQTKMSCCDDREDIYSMALTACSSLLEKYQIEPRSIGRLEVGTETILDKSKSVKTVLMRLFEPSGNTNIEGVDTVNACYGGTSALFNCVNWVQSDAWDGRDAIVVAGDIAIYPQGAARPTGGAGCVAMLVGADAPLAIEPIRGSHMAHAYDFYKPDLTSEYPLVNGQHSLRCYMDALERCYKAYFARKDAVDRIRGATFSSDKAMAGTQPRCAGRDKLLHNGGTDLAIDHFDHMCFHAPTCKLVAKSYGRLLYRDYVANPSHPQFQDVPRDIQDVDHEQSLGDKDIEGTFTGLATKRFNARVRSSLDVATMCGNLYCASLYGSLASLICNEELPVGERIGMFSYGSGLASSLFSFVVQGPLDEMRAKLNLQARLIARKLTDPKNFEEMCRLRERAHLRKAFVPAGDADLIRRNTYYLTGVDEMFRRSYEVKS